MTNSFGKTFIVLFLFMIFIVGAQMLWKISIPWLRKVNPSMADAVESTI